MVKLVHQAGPEYYLSREVDFLRERKPQHTQQKPSDTGEVNYNNSTRTKPFNRTQLFLMERGNILIITLSVCHPPQRWIIQSSVLFKSSHFYLVFWRQYIPCFVRSQIKFLLVLAIFQQTINCGHFLLSKGVWHDYNL